MAKEKPGIMLYWVMFDMLDRVKPEKVKPLLKAIRNLAQYGEYPDFGGDEALELVWPMIEEKVSADSERYEKVRQQRVDAINARWKKERSKTSSENERIQPNTSVYDEVRNIPNTNTNTNTDTNTDTNTERVCETTPARKKPSTVKHKHGEYSNVLLTDTEMEKLQAEYPDYQARIDRLSAYIASKGDSYKSHYATIRNWARKDKEQEKERRSRPGANPCDTVRPEDYEKSQVPW